MSNSMAKSNKNQDKADCYQREPLPEPEARRPADDVHVRETWRRRLRKRLGKFREAFGLHKASGNPALASLPMADNAERTKSECTAAVLDIFRDVCPDYLEQTAAKFSYNHDLVVDEIMRGIDEGKPYPKLPDQKILKRKRDAQEGDEASRARRKYDHADRRKETSSKYVQLSRKVLAQDFPRAAVKSIGKVFAEKDNLLFRTYVAIDKILRDKDLPAGFEMKKTRTPTAAEYLPARLDQTILETINPDAKRALEELRAARLFCQSEAAKSDAAAEKEREEEENFRRAEEDGTVTECGCCFGDFAMNRMVCCDNPSNEHNFCVECARLNAENVIGLSKYELVCMSTDGCNAGFSNSQRSLFLDDKLIAALDRIEAEDVLRMAGVENLETCPFCPFAAEYPPVEENKEFSCANPECLVVSCRLCKEETHIPKSCQEAVSENHSSARREIEEAMSAALIRKCNKCGTPFIKESGCNKMTCTRSGCGNVQCYVCAKSCGYAHFNDARQGGKPGNCPLFDGSVDRHADDVNKAEERARKKIMDDNPDIDENLLKVDISIKERKKKSPAPKLAPVRRVAREPVVQRVILENPPLLQHFGDPFPHIIPPPPPAQDQPRRLHPYHANGFAQPPAENNQQRPRVGHGGLHPAPQQLAHPANPDVDEAVRAFLPRQDRHHRPLDPYPGAAAVARAFHPLPFPFPGHQMPGGPQPSNQAVIGGLPVLPASPMMNVGTAGGLGLGVSPAQDREQRAQQRAQMRAQMRARLLAQRQLGEQLAQQNMVLAQGAHRPQWQGQQNPGMSGVAQRNDIRQEVYLVEPPNNEGRQQRDVAERGSAANPWALD